VCHAFAVLVATLVDDVTAPSSIKHPRPFFVLVLAGVIAAALLALAPRIRSGVVALGAGLAAGGALATLVSGLAWARACQTRSSQTASRSISLISQSQPATRRSSSAYARMPG